jgi:hypothetical protein
MAGHSMATVSGGAKHGLATLSHSELQAAQHALSKIASKAGTLGANLGSLSQSATLIGGSVRANAIQASGFLHGSGSDTFIGGARTTSIPSIGTDTIVGGSAKLVDTTLGVSGTHDLGSFALSTDTINIAGATALSVKALEPETNAKGHTLAVGDKTTITISGLSAHDISKLSH